MKKLILLLAMISLALTACGVKSSLYFPEKVPQEQTSSPE